MLFHTINFFLFLSVVLALFYALPRPARKPLLLAASLFFYMCWNVKFVALLLTLIVVDYGAALWIAANTCWQRRAALLLSLAANLGFLAYFKYYNFLAANLAQALHRPAGPWLLDVILPLGISFHTFQSISYVVDVYRGEQEAIRNPIDYALFVSFFPQLVAGPIVRAREFFEDLYHWNAPTGEEIHRAALLIGLGLVKKAVLADQFALIADQYFGNLAAHPGFLAAWSGVTAFAMQIFFDFSGYTDIAIGTAALFGFHFPENFARPYLALSITDFWRRWHISLSRWLRDYLYIPLGGNRRGRLRTYANLLTTMLLGGLWHGASWNFLIWGGYHGSLLAIERMIFGPLPQRSRFSWLSLPRIVLTFALVCVGWVFFRAATLGDATAVLQQLVSRTAGTPLWTRIHVMVAATALVIAILEESREAFTALPRFPQWAQTAALVVMLLAVELFGVSDHNIPFIYFQF